MFTSRRFLILASASVPLLTGIHPAWADDPTRSDRAIGSPDAKVTMMEFFSLTCGHCAHFAQANFPAIKEKLIDTGKVRLIYRDYPLDQLALLAAMIARHLPAERYEPFILALLSTQERWAFKRGGNPSEELWKMAALAGLSRPAFDKAIGDTALRDWILKDQQTAQDKWKVDSTPSFVINGEKHTGEMSYDVLRKLIPD